MFHVCFVVNGHSCLSVALSQIFVSDAVTDALDAVIGNIAVRHAHITA